MFEYIECICEWNGFQDNVIQLLTSNAFNISYCVLLSTSCCLAAIQKKAFIFHAHFTSVITYSYDLEQYKWYRVALMWKMYPANNLLTECETWENAHIKAHLCFSHHLNAKRLFDFGHLYSLLIHFDSFDPPYRSSHPQSRAILCFLAQNQTDIWIEKPRLRRKSVIGFIIYSGNYRIN